MTRQTARRCIPVLVSILALLAVLGEPGYLQLNELNAVVAHHVLHVLFPLLAFAVFATFVAYDVRKHGWPLFSWGPMRHSMRHLEQQCPTVSTGHGPSPGRPGSASMSLGQSSGVHQLLPRL
jgi:hypothetical protein